MRKEEKKKGISKGEKDEYKGKINLEKFGKSKPRNINIRDYYNIE